MSSTCFKPRVYLQEDGGAYSNGAVWCVVCVCVRGCVFVGVCGWVCVCMCVRGWVGVCVCVGVYMCGWVGVYMCVCVCVSQSFEMGGNWS